ncbi:MAG: DUF2059 domain-containing protein [Dokdonella sp.]
MMIRKIVLGSALAFFSSFAAAAAPAMKPEDAKTKLAIELMQIVHYDRTMQAMQSQIRLTMEKQYDDYAKCDVALPIVREFSSKVGDKIAIGFGSEEMKIDVASAYAEVFGEDELREIIAFYQSPLGKKLLDRMPELAQKSVQISQDRMKSMMPELKQLGEEYGPRIRQAAETCNAAAPTTAAK